MSMKSCLCALLFGLLVATASGSDAFAEENVQTFVEFQGEIIDQNALAISGVLPLEFKVYSGKKLISTEKHFVSVVDGKYQVTLGESAAMTSSDPELAVAVLLDGKELTRQKVAPERYIVNAKPTGGKTQTKYIKLSDKKDGDFSLTCPKGYIVTGIEGRRVNGQMDSLRLVCTNVL